MDFLSAIFFIVAGVWLCAAILYSLMVFYFLRLRSLNLLHTIHDDEFGRVYLSVPTKCCGGCRRSNDGDVANPSVNEPPSRPPHPYYISFGWIFRRYARHLNIDGGSNVNSENDAPRYKRSERRAAVQILLLQQQQQQHQHHQRPRNSQSSANLPTTHCSRDGERSARNIVQRWFTSAKSQTNDAKVVDDGKNDLSHMEQGVAATNDISDHSHCCHNSSTLSQVLDELPICSICLGPYDDDDGEEEQNHPSSSAKSLGAPRPATTTTTTTASDSTIFQSSTCIHQFHMECILNWLQRKTNVECPCCRVPMIHDKEVWKTIQQLRKQKLRAMQKQQRKQREQQISNQKSTTTHHPPLNDDLVDETTNSETEHDELR